MYKKYKKFFLLKSSYLDPKLSFEPMMAWFWASRFWNHTYPLPLVTKTDIEAVYEGQDRKLGEEQKKVFIENPASFIGWKQKSGQLFIRN